MVGFLIQTIYFSLSYIGFKAGVSAGGLAIIVCLFTGVRQIAWRDWGRIIIASLAGNLCNASPAADSVPAVIAAGGIADAAARVFRSEGPRAFWAGAGPRALQLASGTALQWLMYEKGKEAIREATRVIENEERWV